MEANRRNAEDGMTLRMSQASNKDMASGEAGSMVQDDGDHWVVGDEPTPPSSEARENSRDDTISRLVGFAGQAIDANGPVERSALESDVRNLLHDHQKSTADLEMPASWIGDGLQSKLDEELRDLHNGGYLAWATILVWATEQGMEQISIRHPTFPHTYGSGTRFAGGLPWRAVFRTKGDIIHILAASSQDNRLVDRISNALDTARTHLRPESTNLQRTQTRLVLPGAFLFIDSGINGDALTTRFEREAEVEGSHLSTLTSIAQCVVGKRKPRFSRRGEDTLISLFPRLREDQERLQDWNYPLDGFPWYAASDSDGNLVVHGDEHGHNYFIGRGSETPTSVPIDFFDAIIWQDEHPESVGGTDAWRLFASSLQDKPTLVCREQLNSVASFARLVVGLLQRRRVDGFVDSIPDILSISLEALESCDSISKDKPKHNAMFLFAALDWATYWYEHPSGDRLGEEGYDQFNKAIIQLLRTEASVVSRAFEVQYGENAAGDGATIDAEIEQSTTPAQIQAWKDGDSIALLRSSSMDTIERQGLEHRRRTLQRIPVFENERKQEFVDPRKSWFIDATEDWQQECVEALRSWIGRPHDIRFDHPGENKHLGPFAEYEIAVWLPDSERETFDAVDSRLSIHPWEVKWGDLSDKASLRYTLDVGLDEQDAFLAVMQLVMDLILRGLHLQEGHVEQTMYQNMMYAAGTTRTQQNLKLANVNFGVDIGLEQPASDVDRQGIGDGIISDVEARIESLMGTSGEVPFDPTDGNMWGYEFLTWALALEGLNENDKRLLKRQAENFPKVQNDPLPRGLTHYAKWHHPNGVHFQASNALRNYMKRTGREWLRRYLASGLLMEASPRFCKEVFGIMGDLP